MTDRSELHRELDKYIAQRRKKHDYDHIPVKKHKKANTVETQTTNDVVEEEPQKEGFFKRLLDMFKSKDYEEVEESIVQQEIQRSAIQHNQPMQTEVVKDLKEVAKITLEIVKMLPSEQLEAFKRDPLFLRLKELLRKNNLIK